jgi:N-acetylglucosaminyl-diphospho-decaprenol L-rhamnosyltransferase
VSHAVDILSGAFMMARKNILDKIGGFDEQFFMYAEDIDLSFRIRKSGYRNYYLSDTTMIHFKGESTKKDFRYVKMFYTAMELFLKKHFAGGRSSFQLFLLRLGMRFHQTLTYILLPSKKPNGKSDVPSRIFIKGSPESQQLWKQKLFEKKILVSENENEAEEIIYCEGPYQSWKTIITEIANNKSCFRYKFQGAGTHAAVGSYSSLEQGEVFEL